MRVSRPHVGHPIEQCDSAVMWWLKEPLGLFPEQHLDTASRIELLE